MHKMARFVLGAVIAVIIATAGIAAGYFMRGLHNPPASEAVVIPPNIAAERSTGVTELRPYNHTTYKISPPSRGAAIQKIAISLTPAMDGSNGFQAVVNAGDAANVKTGQTVMFLMPDGARKDALGTVADIAQTGTGEQASVTIKIPVTSGKIDDAVKITTAEIITDRRNDAERLPLSAIVTKDGEPYLWEVARNDDGTSSAYIKRTNLITTCGGMAVVQTPSAASNVFILQPDGALKDGDKVNTTTEFYAGDEYTEEQVVASQIEMRYPAPPGPDPYTGPEVTAACDFELSNAKAKPVNAATDFIAKIRSMSALEKNGASPNAP